MRNGIRKAIRRNQYHSNAGAIESMRKRFSRDAGPDLDQNAVAVDVGCPSGNPGPVGWRVTDMRGGIIFESPVYSNGSNNIGEFLAIVYGLRYAVDHNIDRVYSDSRIALKWVSQRDCRTNIHLERDDFLMVEIRKALEWLSANHKEIARAHFWSTRNWGENPADYGRKFRKAPNRLDYGCMEHLREI